MEFFFTLPHEVASLMSFYIVNGNIFYLAVVGDDVEGVWKDLEFWMLRDESAQ